MRLPLAVALAFALAVAVAAACAAGSRSSSPSSADGEALYRARCASCHRLHAADERTATEWAAQVERMAPRARLSDAERARVLDYLQAHAKPSR